jgi:ElaB/YqjD/DUF883 family membrane-anchored ribosome-binding protein
MMTRERVGTEIGLMTGRIKQTFLNGRENVSNAKSAVADKTRRAVRRTDYYVHDNAWKMMGVIAGLAFVAGYFISTKNQEGIAAGVNADVGDATNNPRVQEKVKKLNSWEMVHSAIPLALFFWKAMQASRCAKKGMV